MIVILENARILLHTLYMIELIYVLLKLKFSVGSNIFLRHQDKSSYMYQFDCLTIIDIWWKFEVKRLRNDKVMNKNWIFFGDPEFYSTTWFNIFLCSCFLHNFVNFYPFDVKFSPDVLFSEAIKLMYKWTHILMMTKSITKTKFRL